MTGEPPRAMHTFIDFLGELGTRWGLPAESCRVHGYLYAIARAAPEDELCRAAGLKKSALADALAWLADHGLVTKSGDCWQTGSDPWVLLLRALEERRRREIDPALDLLRSCQRDLQTGDAAGRTASVQVAKLVALVEDLAAIDMQARRLSPHLLRRLVGLGGRVGRLLDRTSGTGDQR